MLGRELIEDRCFNCRRGDTVDANRGVGEFFADGFGECNHCGFAGAVSAGVGVAVFTSHRSDIHDAAFVARLHVRYQFAAAVVQAVDIDVEHLVPIVERVIPALHVRAADAGAVNQRIHICIRQCFLDGIHHLRMLCQIDLHNFDGGLGPVLTQFRHRFVHALWVVVPNRDTCA